MKTILITAIVVTLCGADPLFADATRFYGTWQVDFERTMEESKKSPKYVPGDAERLPVIVKTMMNALTLKITGQAVTYVQGTRELSLPYRLERDDASTVLVVTQDGKQFTLTLSLRDGQVMNVKSSGSDDLDYYIWKRTQ
jgi:hypothetical protein